MTEQPLPSRRRYDFPPGPPGDRACVRCGHVLAGVDEYGPYHEEPVKENHGRAYPDGPYLIFTSTDRVYECSAGQRHQMPRLHQIPRRSS